MFYTIDFYYHKIMQMLLVMNLSMVFHPIHLENNQLFHQLLNLLLNRIQHQMVHTYLLNIAMDFIDLLYLNVTNTIFMNDLLEELYLYHYQYMYKIAYHPNKVHKYENHQLMFHFYVYKRHAFYKIDFLMVKDPNEVLKQTFMVLPLQIVDNQHYLDFKVYQFLHLLAKFHIDCTLASSK